MAETRTCRVATGQEATVISVRPTTAVVVYGLRVVDVKGAWKVVGPDPQFEPGAQLLAAKLRAPVDQGGAGIQEVVVTDVNGLGGVQHRSPISSVMFLTHGNPSGQVSPYTFVNWNEGRQMWEDKATDERWELEDMAAKATQAGLSPFGLLVLFGCKLGDPSVASRRRRVAEEHKLTIAAWPKLMYWQELEQEELPEAKGAKKEREKTAKQLAREKKERMVGTGLVSINDDGRTPEHPALLKPPIIVGRLDEIDSDPEWDLLVDCEKTVMNLAREAGLDVALKGRRPNKRSMK